MTEKKNRPTPKRREVERRKATPRLAPAATKEAKKAQREQARILRARQREAYLRGDESALPIRDRGPVKRFVRNYVDSHRTLGEYFLYIVIPALFLSVVPIWEVRILASLFTWGFIFILIAQGVMHSRRIKKEVAVRFPGESVKGLGMYAFMRSAQMRRIRAPLPQVKRGDQI